jgi:RNA polymerase sigma-70 factor (ECF subfamily)
MISDMPDGVSSMFLLVDVEGHSYQQAADIMGIPVANVVSQLATARLQFAGLAGTHPIHRF